jgi:ubiquinone/menaquinone biosynthesis C-methylase UbiE
MLLNAKFGTETERMRYFSSFVTQHNFDSILDAGCGKGLLFDNIDNFDESKLLIGVDLQKKKGKRYQHIVADARKLPFKNSAFSLVTAFSLLEHIPRTDRKQFYKEMQRVSGSTGTLVIQLPNRYFIIESHTFLPFFGFLPSNMYSFAYRGGYVAVPSLKNVVHSLRECGFGVYAVEKCEASFLPFGHLLSRTGLYRFFPVGYVIFARAEKHEQ